MRRLWVISALLASAACGRSWIFDDTIETLPGSSSSGGHGTGGSGSTGRATGTSTGGQRTGTASSSGSTGTSTGTASSSGGTTPVGTSSGGSTTGSATSGGTTGGCSTKDCASPGDCCPTIPTECGLAGLSGCVFGLCVYESPRCGTSSSSTSGGTSSGASTGGTTGGSSGGATTGGGSSGGTSGGKESCNPNASPVEFLSCSSPSGCGCPLLCVDDALAGQVCEYPCTTTDQCPDLLTVCNGTNCKLDPCGPGTGNGSYNSFCSVTGTDDGSCIPLQLADGTVYGVCAQGGSAATSCNATANRQNLAEVCQAGMVCIGGAIGTGGVCGDVCDPNQGGPCPAGQLCAFTVDDPLAGACYTP
ncbi:MAG: hypothetical protein ACYDCL_04680 [Myxococcales bacterium]